MAGRLSGALRFVARREAQAGTHSWCRQTPADKPRPARLLEQHLEVRPVVATCQPAEAALNGAQRLLADPEGEQRAEYQAERAAKRRAESEQEIARVFVAVHRRIPHWTTTTGVALLQRRSRR